MKTYTVENDEGRQVTFEWDDDNNPPTDSDMEEIFAASKTQESEPPLPEEKEPNAVFPTASQVKDKGIVGIAKKGVLGAMDLLGAGTRAIGQVRGYKMSDPQSALLRPEIDKTTAAIDKMPEIVDKKQYHLPQMGNPMAGASSNRIPAADYREALKAGTEIAGTTLSDPLTLLSLGKNVVAKPLQGAATKIEASILGKGNKSLLKKQGLTANQAAENALNENLGGNLKSTIRKAEDRFVEIEDKIESAVNKAQHTNPNLTIDIDNVLQRVGDRIQNGDPLLYGQTPQAEKAFMDWVDEMGRFGQLGQKPIAETQQIKRMVGSKGFKKGNFGTPDLAAKENVTDLINLELKDELEKVVPEIKGLNQEYKKLIPIKKLAENRLPVSESNDMFGLGRLLTGGGGMAVAGGPAGLLPLALYEASKSGTVAQGLYNTGKLLKKSPSLTGLSVGSNTIRSLQNKYDINERKLK